MSRSLVFALVTAVVSLSIVGAAGELLARAAGREPWRASLDDEPWSTPHPVLGWINREGTSHANEPGRAAMTFWSGGRRRSRPSEAAPARAQRQALLVGGSWFQGHGVSDQDTFAWKLGESHRDWRFDNLGTGGYGTLQAAMSAELAVREQRARPDLVVYGFATFHGMRNVSTWAWIDGLRDRSGHRLIPPRAAFSEGRVVRLPPGTPLSSWPLERHSALVRTLHEALVARALREREAWVAPITRHLLHGLRVQSERDGARLLVMVIFGGDELAPYLSHMSRRGLDWIDCRHPGDPFAPELRVGGIGHPNGRVHDFWARCLGDALDAFDAPPRAASASGGAPD
jgi:hypothetical protein